MKEESSTSGKGRKYRKDTEATGSPPSAFQGGGDPASAGRSVWGGGVRGGDEGWLRSRYRPFPKYVGHFWRSASCAERNWQAWVRGGGASAGEAPKGRARGSPHPRHEGQTPSNAQGRESWCRRTQNPRPSQPANFFSEKGFSPKIPGKSWGNWRLRRSHCLLLMLLLPLYFTPFQYSCWRIIRQF